MDNIGTIGKERSISKSPLEELNNITLRIKNCLRAGSITVNFDVDLIGRMESFRAQKR